MKFSGVWNKIFDMSKYVTSIALFIESDDSSLNILKKYDRRFLKFLYKLRFTSNLICSRKTIETFFDIKCWNYYTQNQWWAKRDKFTLSARRALHSWAVMICSIMVQWTKKEKGTTTEKVHSYTIRIFIAFRYSHRLSLTNGRLMLYVTVWSWKIWVVVIRLDANICLNRIHENNQQ